MIIPDPKGYYRTLGVPRSASPASVKAAFRARAKQTHPDAGGDDSAFHAVTQAYEVLGDRRRRAAYDASCRAIAEAREQTAARAGRDVADRAAGARVRPAGPLDLYWLSHGQVCVTAAMLIVGFAFGALLGGGPIGPIFGFALAGLVWRGYTVATAQVERAAYGMLLDVRAGANHFGWTIVKAALVAVSIVVYLSVVKSLARTAPSGIELLIWFAWPFEWAAALIVPLPPALQDAGIEAAPDPVLAVARHMFLAPWMFLAAYLALQSVKAAPTFILRRYLALLGAARESAASNVAFGAGLLASAAGLVLVGLGLAHWANLERSFADVAMLEAFHDIAVTSFVFAAFACCLALAFLTALLVLAIRASYHYGPGVSDERVVVAMGAAVSPE